MSLTFVPLNLKLDIFAFLYSWPINPIDVVTILMRGMPQAEAGHALSI